MAATSVGQATIWFSRASNDLDNADESEQGEDGHQNEYAEDLKRFAGLPLALGVVCAKAGMPAEAGQKVQSSWHRS